MKLFPAPVDQYPLADTLDNEYDKPSGLYLLLNSPSSMTIFERVIEAGRKLKDVLWSRTTATGPK